MFRFMSKSIRIVNIALKQEDCVQKWTLNTHKTILIHHNLFQTRHFSKIPNVVQNNPKKDIEKVKKQSKTQGTSSKLGKFLIYLQIILIGTGIALVFGAPERDEDGTALNDEFSKYWLPVAYGIRTYREVNYYRKLFCFKNPAKEKLLPDPLQYPYKQPKYTLVLGMIDVLVHPDDSDGSDLRYQKRPLLNYFLDSVKDQYEVVIYTAENGETAFPLLDAVDPNNVISFRLVNDATRIANGNLKSLNRDLSKVICVDWDPSNYINKENLFRIKRWAGNKDDTWLLDLVTFLKAIVDNKIEDVRTVLGVYGKYDDPLMVFTERHKRLIDEMEAQAAAKREKEGDRRFKWKPYFLRDKNDKD